MYTKSAKEYSKVGLQTEVMEADPHKLIALLLEGALTRLSAAKVFIEQNNYAQKNAKIGNVLDIVSALQASLDLEKGGEVALNLERLYDYMTRRLWDANRLNDCEIINEVMGLLMEIKAGWDGIRQDFEHLKEQGLVQMNNIKHELSV